MKWIGITLLLLVAVLALTSGCAYESTYREYAMSQAKMAAMTGPLIELYEDGRLKSVGNPLVPVAMMQMRAPVSEAETFFNWLKMATPFGAIWGIVGAMSSGLHGDTTNVSGTGNLTGNTSGNQGTWASPPTTTTTTTTTMGAE
jgi:hypothetical protein